MILLKKFVEMLAGTPQTRIQESFEKKAPVYFYYTQEDLLEDLCGKEVLKEKRKKIRTEDTLALLQEGDIIFNLLSGKATWVGKHRENYIYTQNYLKMIPTKDLDANYLVYLLNEDVEIQRQYKIFTQGSYILKYSLSQMKELNISELPSIEIQRTIGKVYKKQLRLEYLKKKVAELETIALCYKMKRRREL